MNIPVLIVSGFLGAGKTTFIQQLVQEIGGNKKILIIENDFGEVSFDGTVLQGEGLAVRELTSGCICCTLAGDFRRSLADVLRHYPMDMLIIEPSGVGKTSDILAAFQDKNIREQTTLLPVVALADSIQGRLYLQNFGEFFADQVQQAQLLFLSRTDESPEETKQTKEALQQLHPELPIYDKDWRNTRLWPIIEGMASAAASSLPSEETPVLPLHDHNTDSHHHDEHDHCHHDEHDHCHHDDDPFQTVTIHTQAAEFPEEWVRRIEGLVKANPSVLRVKGILPAPSGYIQIQYAGDSVHWQPSSLAGTTLTIIGSDLDEDQIRTWEQPQ